MYLDQNFVVINDSNKNKENPENVIHKETYLSLKITKQSFLFYFFLNVSIYSRTFTKCKLTSTYY